MSRRKAERRVEEEKHFVTPGTSGAKSSVECVYYHDVPPELYRRAGKRYTGGHKKYGFMHTNLNWRIGINDPVYVADRLNHLFTHLFDFLEHGNKYDDNLGAIVWSAGFLMEVERLAPKVLASVLGHCHLFGKAAEQFRDDLVAESMAKMQTAQNTVSVPKRNRRASTRLSDIARSVEVASALEKARR